MRRILTIVFAAAVLLLGLGSLAIAQSETFLDGKVRTGDRVTVGAGEVIEGDLYVFAGDISINGTVTGDLIAFGGQVEVGGDLIAGAGTVDLTGAVLGDIRVGAGQLQVDGAVSEDVFAGVGRLTIDGTIGGDVVRRGRRGLRAYGSVWVQPSVDLNMPNYYYTYFAVEVSF